MAVHPTPVIGRPSPRPALGGSFQTVSGVGDRLKNVGTCESCGDKLILHFEGWSDGGDDPAEEADPSDHAIFSEVCANPECALWAVRRG